MLAKDSYKVCSFCKIKKHVSEFNKAKSHKDGLHHYCKDCRKLYRKKHKQYYKNYNKQWYKKHKDYARNYNLLRIYNITLQDKQRMFMQQNKVCTICGASISFKNSHVDHNHLTGEVRGLLCKRCNIGLGYFNVDLEGSNILQKAVRYID